MKLKTQNRLLLTVHCLLITAICLFSGCRPQSESDLIRRARLTGEENIRLKKQLKRIEKENAALQKEQSKKQALEAALQDSQDQLQQCRQDLANAPMPCPEVEAQYTKLLVNLTELLAECQQKLEQYEQTQEPQ